MIFNKIHLQKNENNRVQDWFAEINENILTFNWGTKGGKLQEQVNEIKAGKNHGKKNETSPSQQALTELRSTANKKIQNGYSVISAEGILEDLILEDARSCPKPMLAHEFNEHKRKIKNNETVFLQAKFDGLRCLANVKTGELFSRKGKQFFGLDHISNDIKEFGKDLNTDWIDGELYSHSLSFQEISSLTRKKINTVKGSEIIKLMVYDFISTDKYSQRLARLKTAYDEAKTPALLLAEAKAVQWPSEATIEAQHDKFVNEGYEGLMLRRDFPYANKRSDGLLKYKKFFEEEFEIIGMEKEEYEEVVGAFVLLDKNGKKFNARPAMTDEIRKELWLSRDSFDYSQVAGVKYQELTDDGCPRFPILIKLRDKSDCN